MSKGENTQIVCVVTTDLAVHDVLREVSTSMVALAQRMALAGLAVTLLWTSNDPQAARANYKSFKDHFERKYSIKLELLQAVENQQYNGVEFQSFGIYGYLKKASFRTVYLPLEQGLPYYTLLAKETGVYQARPRVIVVAHAPIEWTAEVDRFFLTSIDQAKSAFMEKYCIEHADKLVCVSSSLRRWFLEKGWPIAKECSVLPALAPIEWLEGTEFEQLPGNGTSPNLVLIASPRFRDGISLFCDMLDELAKTNIDNLQVTAVGEFGRILGEHTGGMLMRRGRRWPFRIRLMPNLTLLEGIRYAKHHGSIAVIPNFATATGYCVSECMRLGVPFVATSVGGNVDHVAPAIAAKYLTEPDAKSLASAAYEMVGGPTMPMPILTDDAKVRLWTSVHAAAQQPIRGRKRKAKELGLVSVVVTHHDRPQYLMQAIASLEDQDYANFEVILVDDGSKLPESHAALDRLERKFGKKGWKIIRSENRYVGAARNTGVKAARGEMIIFLDDDNALFPGAISTFVDALTFSQADVCMALSKSVYQSNIPGSDRFSSVSYIPLGGCLDLSLLGNVFGDTISIYRRHVFDIVGFQVEKFGYMVEDWEFFVRIALGGLKLRLIPEALFWYRVSTQGRYRSSHYYDNLVPILTTFAARNFRGLDYLYKIYIGQNIGAYHLESFRTNLQYSPSDEKYFELSNLDPNGSDAITLLAKIAASESREDTAVSLLALAHKGDFHAELTAALNVQPFSLTAIKAAGASLIANRVLSELDLRMIETLPSESSNSAPLAYVEKPDRYFIESINGAISLAILPAGCPTSTVSVRATVSLPKAESEPAEFLMLLCPMHEDPLVSAKSALSNRTEGSSGWTRVATPHEVTVLEAQLAIPSSVPMNLLLALRSPFKNKPILGCFEGIAVRTSVESRVARRPRLGPPPHRQRARAWTNTERNRASLITDYKADLPLLLFPPELEGGLFLRPSGNGPVVAIIENSFPAFASEVLGKVEIAHEEASAFDFALALTMPNSTPNWRNAGPKHPVAFSGWVRVEEKFKLHDIRLKVRDRIPTPLSINLAIRLPPKSKPSPSNAFWRSLVFLWD